MIEQFFRVLKTQGFKLKTVRSRPGSSTTRAFPRRARIRLEWLGSIAANSASRTIARSRCRCRWPMHMPSLPVAYRLYLPESWASDPARRKKAGVPEEIGFQTKPEIALDQIRAACAVGLPRGVVLMDAGYGTHIDLRRAVTVLGLPYIAGILSNTTVWAPGRGPCRLSLTSRAAAGRPNSCAAMPSTNRSKSRILPSAFRPSSGGRSLGAREPMCPSNRVLRGCAFASPIATSTAANLGRKNGF